ncbi:MutS-related protein [Clostridium chauvoei]|uniref:DNA mismatch repair proteins mutS family domain-containing protein n=2 Tax=Clostridium chauvoei TaxID=46867 RepID=A0ABD4RID4_9CLOT|nr:MutS domain-containing protein [Clostridium chauvoei]ATD55586.1 hypothetical protein BTM20_10210 [Clostridium chauvoei]ATD56737.1 hypothetical protein BTM21_02815 [Clostridium chauvoei]MBX7280957.1 hypothetical protein [Clostridium chauvoei]MBX7283434.1 hypothetical protein [Clostridium chauvoei]MBX7285989.1 hypothetical protein [Clostridium chauvoei]
MSIYGGIFEGLGISFLLLESSYYGVIKELEKNKQLVLELYEALGEIEAFISISIYKEILEGNYCEPKFIEDIKLNIEDGVHPLLKNGVPNTIPLNKKVPVFCIIDEIFRGTNPVERISSSMSILKYIGETRALTFVATHDRELTDLLKDKYDFYYFSEDVDSNKGLSFDYKLKEGVSKTKNAIKLLDYIGYPKVITDNARKYAEKLENII